MIHAKKWPQSVALVLVLALAAAGCTAPAGRSSAANASMGIALMAPANRSEIAKELKAAREDLKIIDELIADEDLGLLEDESSSDSEEITESEVSFYMGILEKYDSRLKQALADIKARPELDNKDMAELRKAEIAQFLLACDVVEEYMQVLHYMQSLLDLAAQMDAIGNVSATDPAGMYEEINQAIEKAVGKLKSSEVPSFLQSMNDNMIASLNEMNDAVLYSLIAEEIDDPVRRNGAAYRMGILERKFTRISADANADTEDRMKKLKQDVTTVQQVNEGLSKWVQANLDKLGN